MPEHLDKTTPVEPIICRLRDVLDKEPNEKCRLHISSVMSLAEVIQASNRIIDTHSKLLQQQNICLTSHQRAVDKGSTLVSVLMYITTLVQAGILLAAGYVFTNTEKILQDNAVISERVVNLKETMTKDDALLQQVIRQMSLRDDGVDKINLP